MVFEFSLFGYTIWSFSAFRVEAVSEAEQIFNTGGDFERAEIPYGFAHTDYEDEDDE